MHGQFSFLTAEVQTQNKLGCGSEKWVSGGGGERGDLAKRMKQVDEGGE